MTDVRNEKDLPVPDILGILPLRNTVVFPHAVVPLGAGRASSLRLIEEALAGSRLVGAVLQRDASDDAPGAAGLYTVGTVVVIHKAFKQADGTLRLIVQGLERFRIVEMVQESPYLRARIEHIADDGDTSPTVELEALARSALGLFQRVVSLSPTLPDELANVAAAAEGPSALADLIASSLPTLSTALRQELLETIDVKQRLERLVGALGRSAEVLELGSKIQSDVQSEMSKTQREYYLREQMRAIQKELGDTDERTQEIEALRQKIEAAGMPEEAKGEALRELDRLAKMPPAAAEYTVARTYIDWLVSMPWQQATIDNVDIEAAKAVLDADHEGLEKVKDRILEYLAVKKIRPSGKDPILCFVGPPGVGKTSLGRSIARALGRKFHRISLGGMRDEAEIRGHRRTYIGALPGQVIQSIRRAGSRDPVFMLDEIDKLGADFRGDPASALLEVLDPEQNVAFRDHYLDVAFDLSRVFFITTANVLDTIPSALRDRMEIIELPGYNEEEKVQIARNYLVPRGKENSGLQPDQIEFQDETIHFIVRHYTRETGVRNLERQITSICRKHARRLLEGKEPKLLVTPQVVMELLGAPKYQLEEEVEERVKRPGVVIGLAWTPVGGDILFVEANIAKGGRHLTVTGQVGDVMQESTKAALTWVRSYAIELGLDSDFYKDIDVHIHVPAGSIPKDGPSAGVTMVTSLVSALTNVAIRPKLAMTGEITLSGHVLPVGGIKEKVLAARRAKIEELILPAQNEKNVKEDIQPELLREIKIHYVKTIEEVLNLAFEKPVLRVVPTEPVQQAI